MASEDSGDWEGRYYHIDQVLDAPGPRTDPDFPAGDMVCSSMLLYSPLDADTSYV
jgi:hypothetical protein